MVSKDRSSAAKRNEPVPGPIVQALQRYQVPRDLREWRREIITDFSCIESNLRTPDDQLTPREFALMLKEARRMESDIYRMAEVAGFSREDLDNVGPL